MMTCFLLIAMINVLVAMAGDPYWSLEAEDRAFGLMSTAILCFNLATPFGAGVRRLHDSGHSGWWLGVPIANVALLFMRSDPTFNFYGEPLVQPKVKGFSDGIPINVES